MPRLEGELRELVRTRTLSILREPEVMFWVFGFPIILAIALSLAFRESGPDAVKVCVLEGETRAATIAALEAAERIEVVPSESDEAAWNRLRRGAVDLLVAPGPPPTLHADPQRTEAEYARLRVENALQVAAGRRDAVEITMEAVTERGSRYIDFLIPGLLAMNLMSTGLWGIAFALADLRQRKLLKRLLVTPMRRSSFLLSFVIGRLVLMGLEVALVTAFGVWILDVPFRGSFLGFLVLCLLGSLSFAALGILAASRARTIEGASGVVNLVMMPLWIAGGIFFSYERFPEATHALIRLLPLPPLTDGLRAVMIGGDGLLDILPELVVLTAWGVVSFLVALKIFRWR